LEEERTAFLNYNFQDYANSVSTACVSDDEVSRITFSILSYQFWAALCVALEQIEPEKVTENFVGDYGEGSLILEAPLFSAIDPKPPTTCPRHANFDRSITRPISVLIPPDRDSIDEDVLAGVVNTAGVDAVGLRGRDSGPKSTQQTDIST
jgi:hypothetical protein